MSGGQNQRLPTSWPGDYITPAALGVPTASVRGQNQKLPTSGPGDYITSPDGQFPTASKRGGRTGNGAQFG